MISINMKTKIEKKNNLYYKIKYLLPQNIQFKNIFREYRTLFTIYNKSDYLIQIKGIEFNNNNSKSEIIFIFSDEGIDLYCLIKSNVFDYREQDNLMKWILFEILKGIETLHSLNIIHRDLNPCHIFISSRGAVKIAGFSRSINDIEAKFVEDKVVGILHYIAPECLIGNNYNNKIDLWNFGVLMLEIIYKKIGIFDFGDDSNEDYSIRLFRQLKSLANHFEIPFKFNEKNYKLDDLKTWLTNAKINPEIFNKLYPDLDKDASELLMKLLAFNPKERITAKEALKSPYFKSFQNLNKDEFKKKKIKENNNELSFFLKNLEKEFQKAEALPLDKKNEIFKKEILKISKQNFNDIKNY